MTWPSGILPTYRVGDSVEDHLGKLTAAVIELQRMSQGDISLASVGDVSNMANVDTAVVEVLADGLVGNVVVNNPLGREPVGVVSIMAPSYVNVATGWSAAAQVTITAGSKTVTTVGSFNSNMEKGYLVYSDGTDVYKVKIDTYDGATQLTLKDPAPATVDVTEPVVIYYHWHDDYVILTINTVGSANVAYVRLLFF